MSGPNNRRIFLVARMAHIALLLPLAISVTSIACSADMQKEKPALGFRCTEIGRGWRTDHRQVSRAGDRPLTARIPDIAVRHRGHRNFFRASHVGRRVCITRQRRRHSGWAGGCSAAPQGATRRRVGGARPTAPPDAFPKIPVAGARVFATSVAFKPYMSLLSDLTFRNATGPFPA